MNEQTPDSLSYRDELTELIYRSYSSQDVQQYLKHVVNGDLYEVMADKFGYHGCDARVKAKKTLFTALFATNRSIGINKPMQTFKKAFPTVYSIFAFVKRGKTKYHSLACTLQNLEAKLILHEVVKVLLNTAPDCPVITIHDSICTTLEYEETVRKAMNSTFLHFMNLVPNIKREVFQ